MPEYHRIHGMDKLCQRLMERISDNKEEIHGWFVDLDSFKAMRKTDKI